MNELDKCPKCESEDLRQFSTGRIVCAKCGWSNQPKDEWAHQPEETAKPSDQKPRPWNRWAARVLDMNLFAILVGFVFGSLASPALDRLYETQGVEQIFGLIVLFLYIFVESLLLSTWGTTPGKALLRIQLRQSNGERLSYSQALKRSFTVWLTGLGIGFPIVSLITLIRSYNFLTKEGITGWDRAGHFSVSHQPISPLRGVAIVLSFIALVAFLVWGNLEGLDSSYLE